MGTEAPRPSRPGRGADARRCPAPGGGAGRSGAAARLPPAPGPREPLPGGAEPAAAAVSTGTGPVRGWAVGGENGAVPCQPGALRRGSRPPGRPSPVSRVSARPLCGGPQPAVTKPCVSPLSPGAPVPCPAPAPCEPFAGCRLSKQLPGGGPPGLPPPCAIRSARISAPCFLSLKIPPEISLWCRCRRVLHRSWAPVRAGEGSLRAKVIGFSRGERVVWFRGWPPGSQWC